MMISQSDTSYWLHDEHCDNPEKQTENYTGLDNRNSLREDWKYKDENDPRYCTMYEMENKPLKNQVLRRTMQQAGHQCLIQMPLGHSFHPPPPPNRILRQRHSRGRKQTCCKTYENRGWSQSFSAPEHYRYDKSNMCLLSAFASSISQLVREKAAQKTGLTNQH